MDLYSAKQRWKVILIFISILIIGASLFVSNQMIQKIAERDRSKAKESEMKARLTIPPMPSGLEKLGLINSDNSLKEIN